MPNPRPSLGSLGFPTVARLVRWFFNWRIFGRVLVGCAALLTLIGVFYGEENWRGQHAWNVYRHEFETRGAGLDYQALWPKPVPDDQNFAATPSIKTWFQKPDGEETNRRWKDNFSLASKRVPTSRSRMSETHHRQFMDLVAWGMAFAAIQAGDLGPRNPQGEDFVSDKLDLESRAKAAPGVLEGLSTNETLFAELRAASRRPFARYPFNYESPWEILWPNDLYALYPRLELKACAELAAGQSERALEDVKLMLYMVDAQKAEPFLLSQWGRVHHFRIAVHPIWEGLGEHAWSAAQLQELTTRLQRYDFLADCKLGLDGGRAADLWMIDCIRNSGQPSGLGCWYGDRLFGDELANLIARLMPSGWYAREKLAYCQLFEIYLRSGFEPARKRVSPAAVEASAAEANRLSREQYSLRGLRAVLAHRFVAAALIQPDNFGIIRGFCVSQAIADQAALACALEQHRLAHGRFPEKLEALTPQFISRLPNDAITGEPYKYRRTDDGQFVLYSVGWNERDEGGTIALNKDGSVAYKNGDWVWECPVK